MRWMLIADIYNDQRQVSYYSICSLLDHTVGSPRSDPDKLLCSVLKTHISNAYIARPASHRIWPIGLDMATDQDP